MTTSHGKILITDDDANLRKALHTTMQTLGFEIAECSNGEQAVKEITYKHFDVVLLDINMPGMGGIEACRELRRLVPGLQILMLTVRDREEDKVKALEAGADDYITKPFSVKELSARIKTAVRRVRTSAETARTITVGEIALDPERRTVRKANTQVHLTPKEFDLLHYLMAHAGYPITHRTLLQRVWGTEYGGELEYLRTFIHQLRRKLEDDPASPKYLLTESWLGYRFLECASLETSDISDISDKA